MEEEDLEEDEDEDDDDESADDTTKTRFRDFRMPIVPESRFAIRQGQAVTRVSLAAIPVHGCERDVPSVAQGN